MSVKNRIGILGGLGPETTAMVYLNIINNASTKVRPDIVIYNVPLDIKKEKEYVVEGKNKPYYLQALKKGIKALEQAQVSKIAIACNTVHEFYDQMQASTNVPIVPLINKVAEEAKKRKWKKALVLATSEIVQTGLYQDALKKFGIKSALPNSADQTVINNIIIKILKFNKHDSKEIKQLRAIVNRSETKQIILGCSDLFQFFQSDKNVIDSMDVLTKVCVDSIKN